MEEEEFLPGPGHHIHIERIKVHPVVVMLVGLVGSVEAVKVIQLQQELELQLHPTKNRSRRVSPIEIHMLIHLVILVLPHTVTIIKQTFTIITFNPFRIHIKAIFSPKQQVSVNCVYHKSVS